QGPIPVTQSIRYIFGNMERTSGFLLDESALTFQTTAYDTFEVFLSQFLAGLRTVNEVAGLNFTERVGVRYLTPSLPAMMGSCPNMSPRPFWAWPGSSRETSPTLSRKRMSSPTACICWFG